MPNELMTPEQAAKEIGAILEKHGIPQMLLNASPEEREIMVTLLANMFGAGFPIGDGDEQEGK